MMMCLQVLEQWDIQQGQGSPQTSLSAPVVPLSAPIPNHHLHRASVPDSAEAFGLPKPDPYDLYEKSRAIYESRRKYCAATRLFPLLGVWGTKGVFPLHRCSDEDTNTHQRHTCAHKKACTHSPPTTIHTI